MVKNFNRHYACPWCRKGETLADGNAKGKISLVCAKCLKVYTVDLDTDSTERSSACIREKQKAS